VRSGIFVKRSFFRDFCGEYWKAFDMVGKATEFGISKRKLR
jgi:hypothetical protein